MFFERINKRLFVVLIGVLCLFHSGCDSAVKWSRGNYEVYWIDSPGNLQLGYRLGSGRWVGRVQHQVIAVGASTKWIVAQRRPPGSSEIEYYYWLISLDGEYKNASDVVKGPFTKSQFANEGKSRDFPKFSTRF